VERTDTLSKDSVVASQPPPEKLKKKQESGSRLKWTTQEVSNLAKGVQEIGEGHWSIILNKYQFQSKRTGVNLKVTSDLP